VAIGFADDQPCPDDNAGAGGARRVVFRALGPNWEQRMAGLKTALVS
jgi:hypothetical protein